MSEDGISEAASENQPGEEKQSAPSDAQGEDGIAEAASEITPKRKRGRPGNGLVNSARPDPGSFRSLLPGETFVEPMPCGTEARTLRGCQNAEYANRAWRALFELRDEFPEVLELVGCKQWETGEITPDVDFCDQNAGVLTELGRILWTFRDGPRVAARLAVDFLKIQPRPKSKEAVVILRRWRLQALGKTTGVGDVKGLALVIAKAIEGYRKKKPATPDEVVIDALEWVLSLHLPDDDEDDGQDDDAPP
jgi:hypothetical protein